MTRGKLAPVAHPQGIGAMRTLRNWIGGQWVESSATEFLEITNPATAEPLGCVPLSTGRDVDQAVAAAGAAFPAWRAVQEGGDLEMVNTPLPA